jgi:hypothetical protein
VVCNRVSDCFDDTDERECEDLRFVYSHYNNDKDEISIGLPAIIHFSKYGYFSHEPMHNHSCPETHYRCVSQAMCLPVYTRCNGYFD